MISTREFCLRLFAISFGSLMWVVGNLDKGAYNAWMTSVQVRISHKRVSELSVKMCSAVYTSQASLSILGAVRAQPLCDVTKCRSSHTCVALRASAACVCPNFYAGEDCTIRKPIISCHSNIHKHHSWISGHPGRDISSKQ